MTGLIRLATNLARPALSLTWPAVSRSNSLMASLIHHTAAYSSTITSTRVCLVVTSKVTVAPTPTCRVSAGYPYPVSADYPFIGY